MPTLAITKYALALDAYLCAIDFEQLKVKRAKCFALHAVSGAEGGSSDRFVSSATRCPALPSLLCYYLGQRGSQQPHSRSSVKFPETVITNKTYSHVPGK